MRDLRPWLMLLACCLLAACGQGGDRYGSVNAAPAGGVSPWYKVDLDPDQDLVQPYILLGDPANFLTEPCYLMVGETHHLFYENVYIEESTGAPLGSDIRHAVSDDGIAWELTNDGEPVLVADLGWETGGVSAPSVLWRNGEFTMWYAAGDGSGIGMAVSADGDAWEKRDEPVLAPDREWEGGETGVVAAPCVIRYEGSYRLYYSGGVLDDPALAGRYGRAIGYATSEDGVAWVKRDAPVLAPDQEWEGGEFFAAVAASPYVRVDRAADRDLFRLYYTGNALGEPVLDDVSIGYAGSFDGVAWEKLKTPYNPVLNEKFPLTFFGVSQYVVYGEFAPSVLKFDNNSYRMIFGQTDILGSAQGLALAVHPQAKDL